MKKRLLSIFLVMVMVLSLAPASIFAEETEASTCICETSCTSQDMNDDCPVCGAEGASLENCGKYVPADEPQTDGATAVTLTLFLPAGLSADDMEAVDDSTYKVTSTVKDGSIIPITIFCEDEGAFSAELAEQINKNSSISDNGLNVTYNSESDTLTISGSPISSVELDMNAILTSAMEEMNAYATTLAEDTHTHCVCGNASCEATDGGHSGKDTEWQAWTSENSLPSEDNYYLTADVKLSSTHEIENGKTLNLCLNGYTITGASGLDVIKVASGGNLNITDCTTDSSKMGKITHNSGEKGRGIYNNGTLNLWNGSVSGNSLSNSGNSLPDSSSGGGIYNRGTLNMYGGSITDNCVDGTGGGVYSKGNVNMTGGSISYNTAQIAGGICSSGNHTFTMSGGNITGNTAKNYGGVLLNNKNSNFNMTGGSITKNAANEGGGVRNYGTFTMTGGSITANNASEMGGGIQNSGTLKMSGAVTVSGNTKGGTFVNKTLSGGVANNVYLPNGKTITVDTAMDSSARVGISVKDPEDPENLPTVVTGSTNTDVFSSDSADYKLVDNKEGGLKLANQEVTINITGGDYVYNGNAQAPANITVTGNKVPVSELVKTYKGVDGTTYESTNAPKNAGKYTMTVSVSDSNKSYTGSATCDFEIKPKTLTVKVTAQDKKYDGNDKATADVALVESEIAKGDTVSLNKNNMTATFNTAEVGINKVVTICGLSLNNNDAGNYKLPESITAKAAIIKKTINPYTVETTSKSGGADTGDNSNMAFWLMLLLASSGVITLTTQASCF